MENYSSNQLYMRQNNNKQISIFPVLDGNNVLSQELIQDKYGNPIKYLSNFRYIEIDNKTNEFKGVNILVDLDVNLYNNDINYRNAIYSKLLSFSRINKICNEYYRYAGGLYFNQNSGQYEKYVEQEILDSLNYKEQLKEQERLSSFQKRRKDFLRRTATNPVHIKDSHAEILTQSKYQEMYGTSSSQYHEAYGNER